MLVKFYLMGLYNKLMEMIFIDNISKIIKCFIVKLPHNVASCFIEEITLCGCFYKRLIL